MMNTRTYRFVIDTILAICLLFIIGLVMYGIASDQPTRGEIIIKLEQIERRITILDCKVEALDAADRAVCDEIPSE